MKNLFATLVTLTMLGATAHAAEEIPDFYRLHPAVVQEVVPTALELYSTALTARVPTPSDEASPTAQAPSPQAFEINWDTIVAIGEKIWQIVQAGRPVTNVTRTPVSVVPGGVTSWSQLGGWQAPVTKVFRVSATNYLGMTVVDLRLKVSAMYGGGLDGRGKYLANVNIVPTQIDTLWGFTVDVWSEASEPVNMNTTRDPVAGLGFDLRYRFGSPLKMETGAQDYFVTGLGELKQMN